MKILAFLSIQNRLTNIENKLMVTTGEREGAEAIEGWESKMYKLSCIK